MPEREQYHHERRIRAGEPIQVMRPRRDNPTAGDWLFLVALVVVLVLWLALSQPL